jgi:hypothetical protein
MTPFAGSPSSTVDNNGETNYTFTSANGLQPATTYAVGALALEDNNHHASTVVMLAEGYTAYATPVFGNVIVIDYVSEQLTFAGGYSSGDYTMAVHCASCSVYGASDTLVSPYALTALLDDVSNTGFHSTLAHNAGVTPPYLASEAASSVAITGRAAAPTGVNTVNASSSTSYNGEIHLAGAFEYRIHGTTAGWNAATNTAANLGAGNYDVRRPAARNRRDGKRHDGSLPTGRYIHCPPAGGSRQLGHC